MIVANTATNKLDVTVLSYNPANGALSADIDTGGVGGSGEYTSWSINTKGAT